MAFKYKDLNINKLSVIGAGQIGPDICLHFAKVFWRDNVDFVIIDISEDALANAKAKIEKKINRGQETGAFKPAMADAMKASIKYTTNYDDVAGSNLVVEAATEDERIKDIIFKQVEERTDDNCLFFSNSSHMKPEVIFRNITNKGRTMVTHYFFPAERNPVVEVVPGAETNSSIVETVMGLYELIGKVPIEVKSSYGYAIDPIFEGLCELAILCLEKGYGSVKEIDKMAQKTLRQGVGPFTALNLTGGNPITNHGLEEMRDTHIQWFRSPKTLQEMTESGAKWDTAKRGEQVDVSPEKAEVLRKQFLGGYFALCCYIIDLGISSVNDLDMATEISLVISSPFTLMNKIGIDESHAIVKEWCEEHTDFPFPKSLDDAKAAGGWKPSRIVRSTKDDVAVLTIRRPKVLNALNLGVLGELKDELAKAEADSSIKAMVITGFGTKAFVSGADIQMLAALKTPEEGINNASTFQAVLNYIENLQKPVVCAFNGFAFGGGNELAMACTTRVSKNGLPVLACQPEVNLGFIPGAGGTQRLPRLVGVEKAAEILRTGRPVSSQEAVEIGMIHKEIEGDLIVGAVEVATQLADGTLSLSHVSTEPMSEIGSPKSVELGHLSTKIDEIINKAIYEGAGMTLSDGLQHEANMFGECMKTQDMKIGLENFKTNGPRAKAVFINS